jgi:hypothetical protein
MILSLRKRFDDYETMGEVFKDFKNKLLETKTTEPLILSIDAPLKIRYTLLLLTFTQIVTKVFLETSHISTSEDKRYHHLFDTIYWVYLICMF